jgi:hypothetical protein
MTRRSGPIVVLALAVVAAQAIAVLVSESPWMPAVGALLFALALVGADTWVSRLRADSSRPSRKGLVLALAFLAACSIGTVGGPQLLTKILPFLAGGAAIPVLFRRDGTRTVRRSGFSSCVRTVSDTL